MPEYIVKSSLIGCGTRDQVNLKFPGLVLQFGRIEVMEVQTRGKLTSSRNLVLGVLLPNFRGNYKGRVFEIVI